MMNPVPTFVLLDDAVADDTTFASRFYSEPLEIVACMRAEDVASCFARIDQALADGMHAVGLFDYELGHALLPRTGRMRLAQPGTPLFSVLLFDRCERLNGLQVEHRLAALAGAGGAAGGVESLRANVERADYLATVERIRAYIADGETYQVNYTYKLKFDTLGDPVALYLALRARQRVPYGALIALPGRMVLSFSPELFVRKDGDRLTAKPMKGTARASGDPDEDIARAGALARDEKNRAENLMIVDLLRNDLGRLAKPGTVRVPALFSVDRYGEVLQMTSTITAAIDRPRGLHEYFQALFPCGSITGAPKIRTMQIIRELEVEPRGLYTGAIGWFEPNDPCDAATGHGPDFCLSVPIRTLVLDAAGRGEMGIGSGIVHDSDPAAEYDECRLKAHFLTGLAPGA